MVFNRTIILEINHPKNEESKERKTEYQNGVSKGTGIN